MDFCICAFTNLTISCDRQGIDHPDSVPVPDSKFVRLTVASLSVVGWAIAPRRSCLLGSHRTGMVIAPPSQKSHRSA